MPMKDPVEYLEAEVRLLAYWAMVKLGERQSAAPELCRLQGLQPFARGAWVVGTRAPPIKDAGLELLHSLDLGNGRTLRRSPDWAGLRKRACDLGAMSRVGAVDAGAVLAEEGRENVRAALHELGVGGFEMVDQWQREDMTLQDLMRAQWQTWDQMNAPAPPPGPPPPEALTFPPRPPDEEYVMASVEEEEDDEAAEEEAEEDEAEEEQGETYVAYVRGPASWCLPAGEADEE